MNPRTVARRIHWLSAMLLWLASPCGAALPDGPYVLPGPGGWQAVSLVVTPDGAQRETRPLGDTAAVRIAAVGEAPAFDVPLRGRAAPAAAEVHPAPDAPLFVVADTHGEYQVLVALLRAQGVVDARLRWSYARGHLAVLGDVFDRGPNHLEILWLLYKLEAEAARAGGGVHLLLGNHEVMVLRGDLRYLHPRYVESARVLAPEGYDRLFAPDALLGQWLRSRPAMLKLRDQLCLHAGVSRALLDSTLTLADVNEGVRAAIEGPGSATAELLLGSLGPLWYRGYFEGQRGFPPANTDDVERTLRTFGVRRILIGHTIVPTITPLFDGRVVAVQVSPRAEDGRAQLQGLLLQRGELWQAALDGARRRLSRPASAPGAR